MATYFVLWYRLSNSDAYLIWLSNDVDGVFVDSDGFVPSFQSVESLRAFADKQTIVLENEEPILHDLDIVRAWQSNPKDSEIDCEAFLAAWNLFGDIAHSIGENHDFVQSDENANDIYDKLFWGNNLPSMTPEGQKYIPKWTADELAQMQEIMANGLNLFERSILVYG